VIYVVRFGRASDGRTSRCGGKFATQAFDLSAGDAPNKVLKEAPTPFIGAAASGSNLSVRRGQFEKVGGAAAEVSSVDRSDDHTSLLGTCSRLLD
jgi:hypothetical protein